MCMCLYVCVLYVCVFVCVSVCVFVCVFACDCVNLLFSFSVCYLFICISLQFGGIKVEIKKSKSLQQLGFKCLQF